MEKSNLLKIGYIAKTHGLKGEVTAQLQADALLPEVGAPIMLELNGGMVPYFVTHISVTGSKAYLKFDGIDTIEAATSLKGASLLAEKSLRPKLKRGEFYDDELTGFSVVDEKAGMLGAVLRVENQGLNKLLVIGDAELLIPVNGPFIQTISKTKKRIEVSLPEGFLDL